MKADVVIDFYRKHLLLPHLFWGLRANEQYINDVIIVNDELWKESDIELLKVISRRHVRRDGEEGYRRGNGEDAGGSAPKRHPAGC